MMFLTAEDIIKRISIILSIIIIVSAAGAAVWYNSNLKDEFEEGKTESNQLRQETSRLGAMTDEIKHDIENKAKELKNSIIATKDETVRVDKEIKTVQQDTEKFKNETKLMNSQLVELLKSRDQEIKIHLDRLYKEQEKFRQDVKIEFEKLHTNDNKINKDIIERYERLELEIAKLKDMNIVFNAMLRQRDKEIEDLSRKLDKEIEWRTKYQWNR